MHPLCIHTSTHPVIHPSMYPSCIQASIHPCTIMHPSIPVSPVLYLFILQWFRRSSTNVILTALVNRSHSFSQGFDQQHWETTSGENQSPVDAARQQGIPCDPWQIDQSRGNDAATSCSAAEGCHLQVRCLLHRDEWAALPGRRVWQLALALPLTGPQARTSPGNTVHTPRAPKWEKHSVASFIRSRNVCVKTGRNFATARDVLVRKNYTLLQYVGRSVEPWHLIRGFGK